MTEKVKKSCNHDYSFVPIVKPIYESRYPSSPYLPSMVKVGEEEKILKICNLCNKQLILKIKE